MGSGVQIWWTALSVVAVLNMGLWVNAARVLARKAPALPDEVLQRRRTQLWLSLVYVVVCAFRSFLPRADVQRICLVDSWWSNIAVGRTLATVAELCFAIQWALLVHELGRTTGNRYVVGISRMLVPLIVFAECASWYAVLTTRFLGNALEQSTWTFCGLLVLICCAVMWTRAAASGRGAAGGRS